MAKLSGKLSVLMPAYNEEAIIYENALEAARQICPLADDYELLVIDDGSSDRTKAEIERAAAENPKICCISYQPNQGKGGALREGTAHATGDYIAFCDADLDLAPEQLADFIDRMQRENADVVIGSKMHPESKVDYPAIRRVYSWGYYILLLILFRLNVRDTQTGLKLFKAEVIKPVMRQILVKRFAFDIEVLAIINARGCPNAHIVQEVYTGTKYQGRKELDKLLRIVEPGDTIVFDSVSRMSRNADEGCQLYEELFDRQIKLHFLKEPHIDTETYRQTIQRQISTRLETGSAATDSFVSAVIDALNQYTVALAKEQIRLAFGQAQKEVDDLHQRTKEGMLTAKLNGKQIGQTAGRKLTVKKAAPCKEQIRRYSKDFDGTLSDTECIKLIGIARNTYYKYKRELRESGSN